MKIPEAADELDRLTTELAQARADAERKQAVIAELVACKDLGAEVLRRDVGGDMWYQLSTEYLNREKIAWSAARAECVAKEGGR